MFGPINFSVSEKEEVREAIMYFKMCLNGPFPLSESGQRHMQRGEVVIGFLNDSEKHLQSWSTEVFEIPTSSLLDVLSQTFAGKEAKLLGAELGTTQIPEIIPWLLPKLMELRLSLVQIFSLLERGESIPPATNAEIKETLDSLSAALLIHLPGKDQGPMCLAA